ncbi:MAG: NAD-dependent epimerase/dehydratase family protein [Treponema sp.]|nr:NAD-dependent epimerase/dehydratase family protein [Treponema sp.]
MNILLTGKLDSITMHLIAAAGPSHRIIMAAKTIPAGEYPNNVRPFSIGPGDTLFESVTRVGSFDAAVFFMARGEHGDKTEGGVTSLQSMLKHCQDSGVDQVILVSSGEVFSGVEGSAAISEDTPAAPKGAQGLQIKAAEDMCQQYRNTTQKSITIVRLPFIYQRDNAADGDGLLSTMFKAVLENRKKFELPGSPNSRCDFLSDVEAARLIWLIIDEGISARSIFVNAGTGKTTEMQDIANLAAQHFPELSIKYTGNTSDIPPPMRTRIAKSEYGWTALHNLTDDFDEILKSVTTKPIRKYLHLKKILEAVKSFLQGSKGFIVVEFAVATVILILLTNALRGFSFAYWLDLRLLFVVILSTLHGTIPGIAAGAIGGVLLFFTMGGTDWRLIVYNPENWIPFALYIIMGVALGSRADRQTDSMKSIQDRLDLAEQTNVYLVELYDEAVRIKDSYRDQILGYKDNFGRIYSIVKKLNSEMSEYVFSSAIEVVEDVLENHTVAIYSMSTSGDYARMTVCSKSLFGEAARSLRLHDFRQIMEKMEHRDIWFNRDLIAGFPSYCAPIYNEDKIIVLVMIWKAGVEQMTLHYSNLFRILTGLIQESLVRAVKFNKLRESTSYYPDTRILLDKPFWEAYRANLTLAEKENAQFGLVTVNRNNGELIEQNNNLESCIRETDVVGAIIDSLFGVILKNVSPDDVRTLVKRFKSKNIKASQVSVAEMNEYMKKTG